MQQFQQQPQQGWQGNQGIGSAFGADPYTAWAQGAGQPQGGPQAMPGYTVH
jgi:hypothetical protein